MTDILYSSTDNPLPGHGPGQKQGSTTAGFFTGVGGKQIRYAIFRSDAQVARGTVVLLQGRNESIEKYYETISEFLARGLWVATFDWRGQGGSDRLLKQSRRGHVRRFADYEADLSTFLEQIVLPDTRLPFFMVAHSMGALIALSHAPLMANRIDRLVVCAPFVALGAQPLGQGLIGFLAATVSFVGLGFLPLKRDRGSLPFEKNLLTSDARRFARNAALTAAQPQLALGPPTARWLHETFKAIRRVTRREHLTTIRVPTIVLAPTQDRLVPHLAVENLARNFRAGHMIPIDGGRHELLQEADHYRAQAIAAIEAFIPGSDDDMADLAGAAE
ncbi:alpha/beta hydrolase [Rhizobium sp. 32-5/1]|uniref:alpha/beta fold hydrolase n=1 Tax=Rhizobium sp. 32-5/1 TaxID=3019602 RepID=UPI00240E355B|nr:alpha/beta hydrolase [Rhizobium sp. 32-5/1]WEZ82542.1 alpha/beta hydrolase [Rhizobium sp. 32-5/1]